MPRLWLRWGCCALLLGLLATAPAHGISIAAGRGSRPHNLDLALRAGAFEAEHVDEGEQPEGIPKAAQAGHPVGAGAKPVTPEQLELSRRRAENARLRMHVDILKSDCVLRQGCAVKYAWIDAQRHDHPLPAPCEVLGLSISG